MKQPKTKCCMAFTERLQRSFVLKAVGLSNKQAVEALSGLGHKTNETAIVKHPSRINSFYRNNKGECSMDHSISKAWQSGDMQRLIKKYRADFKEHIEEFEKHREIWFENLP